MAVTKEHSFPQALANMAAGFQNAEAASQQGFRQSSKPSEMALRMTRVPKVGGSRRCSARAKENTGYDLDVPLG
jgi:hypothetical protein